VFLGRLAMPVMMRECQGHWEAGVRQGVDGLQVQLPVEIPLFSVLRRFLQEGLGELLDSGRRCLVLVHGLLLPSSLLQGWLDAAPDALF
jgi:hypothetical protein